MKTEIVKIKGDWQEVVDDCRSTVSKPPLGKEPSVDFKKKILLAEHSPIRDIYIKWKWKLMPHWVTVHWVRHKWECFVSTQRTDRTGVDRNNLPQDEPQNFTGDANVQHLIDTMRKRLCYQASKETREYAEDLKKAIYEVEPEIANVLVPNCVYRCGCPEAAPCGFWRNIKAATNGGVCADELQRRYDLYNAVFYNKGSTE